MSFLKWMIGLCFFLYAMSVLEQTCRELAQGRAKSVLGGLAGGRFKAVFGGMAATLLLQSSSIVSVLLIALTGSNVLRLSQAAGVLAGANIATTATAWMVAWMEEGVLADSMADADRIFQMIAIVAAVGVCMLLRPEKKERKERQHRLAGNFLMGFAILLYGLELMCDTTAALIQYPAVKEVIEAVMEHPAAAFFVGAISTAVLQSSSATIAILQGIALVHPLTCHMVIPALLGQNLGTCSTSMLAAMGSTKEGREVARMNLAYNVYGILPFFILYLLCSSLLLGDRMEMEVSAMGIAAFHTCYNLFTVVLVYPPLYCHYNR